MCVLLSLKVPFCGCEEEEEAIVEARSWRTSLDPSSIEVGASFGGKKLKAFLAIVDLCFMDPFLGFLVPRWRLYEQMVSISLDLSYSNVICVVGS